VAKIANANDCFFMIRYIKVVVFLIRSDCFFGSFSGRIRLT